ncbi:hypothetical protein GCM10022223_62920 [Kineosporia mesophila]|uniref:Uncharacterized protein n=1 Tax=Kineosporia mesophila TaxID=566012 RepID=A0ABP7AN34_9ACTN|nr:hypothetical protein [Kineosporia mesophila]MCD5354558.1 hypothetical protein [Kineosporia mesophila]
MDIWNWFLTVTGSNDMSSAWYGFWSGFGADLGEFAIVGGLISVYRQHICHARRCWRRGRYQVEGTKYRTCRKHDPSASGEDDDPTAEEIAASYRRARVALHRPHLRGSGHRSERGDEE